MASPEREQALALAGLLQALAEVRQVAAHGQGERRRIEPCLRALLGRWEGSVATLYGGRDTLEPGLRLLMEHLSQPREMELTRYLVAVMQLERRLRRDRKRFDHVLEGIAQAAKQAEYFGSVSHDSVLRNLGELYQENVSALRPRILVRGHQRHLEDPYNAALIRSLLLAAVRAASLWRAAGGSRLRLVLGRRGIVEAARSELAHT